MQWNPIPCVAKTQFQITDSERTLDEQTKQLNAMHQFPFVCDEEIEEIWIESWQKDSTEIYLQNWVIDNTDSDSWILAHVNSVDVIYSRHESFNDAICESLNEICAILKR